MVVEHLRLVEDRLGDGEGPMRVAGEQDTLGEGSGWMEMDRSGVGHAPEVKLDACQSGATYRTHSGRQ
jgi:hypothetical protein